MIFSNIKNYFFNQHNNKLNITTDIHSHLIPNIDDGSSSLEESIELIKSLKSLGYEKLITTPHIKKDQFPNTAESILEDFKILQQEIKKQNIMIEIDVAAEYFFDENFISLIDRGELLTFGDNYLLFELSYISPPLNLEEIIYKISSKGYKPVLAHPERFLYFCKNFEKYTRLKELGVYFQLNINSLSGYYSKVIKKNAEKLIEHSYIDFIGSDTHHQRHIKALKKSINSSYYNKIFETNNILNDKLVT